MHKFIHLISILASATLVLIALAACNDAEGLIDNGGNVPVSDKPIAFTASDEWNTLTETRGTSQSSFSKGDAIGVFAYLNNSTSPNFMNDQKVTFDGNNWTYEPVKYWPSNEEDRVDFYAYWPYGNNAIQAIPNQDGTMNIRYHCPNADIDLMASDKVKNQNYASNSGKIPFNLHHLLARVRFTFTYEGEDDYRPVIHKLQYTVPYTKGVATCYAEGGNGIFSWSTQETESEGATTIERYVTDVAGTILHSDNQIIPEFTAYLMPYPFPYSSTDSEHIGVFTISINNQPHTYKPKSQINLEAGTSYTVNFKITNDYGSSGTYFVTSYSIWKDGGTINGTLE